MIKVYVKFLGGLVERIGKKDLWVNLKSNSTIEELLNVLDNMMNRKVKSLIIDEKSGKVYSHIRILVNGRDITFFKGLKTIIKDEDSIIILPAVAGGNN